MQHRQPNPNKTKFQPQQPILPVRHLNMRMLRQNTLLYHPHLPNTEWETYFDEEGYNKYNAAVYEKRVEIFHKSLFHSPVELYKYYPVYASKEEFTIHSLRENNILARIGDTYAWCSDIAQITQLYGMVCTGDMLRQSIVEVKDDYAPFLERDLAAFKQPTSRTAVPPLDDHIYRTNIKSTVYEVYDADYRLLLLLPCGDAAVKWLGVPQRNTKKYMDNHWLVQDQFYLKDYYDNNYSTLDKLYYDQLEDGRIVNSFYSGKEVAEVLDIGVSELHRHIYKGKIDKYGCSWQLHTPAPAKLVEDCPEELRRFAEQKWAEEEI